MIIAAAEALGGSADKFIYCRVEGGRILEQESVFTPPGGEAALIKQLLGLEIDLLIAGKLSDGLEYALTDAGIAVINNVNGQPEQILKQYLDGKLNF